MLGVAFNCKNYYHVNRYVNSKLTFTFCKLTYFFPDFNMQSPEGVW